MKPILIWTPRAEEDLLEIYVSIGLENASAADRIYDKLKSKARLLIQHPRLGIERTDIALKSRVLIERNYLIFYRIAPDEDGLSVAEIEIIRLVDGSEICLLYFHKHT